MKIIIEGKFYLNEQDPHEPTGILFIDEDGYSGDLANILEANFELDRIGRNKKKLKIMIEEIGDIEECKHEDCSKIGISRYCKSCKKWLPDPDGSIPL